MNDLNCPCCGTTYLESTPGFCKCCGYEFTESFVNQFIAENEKDQNKIDIKLPKQNDKHGIIIVDKEDRLNNHGHLKKAMIIIILLFAILALIGVLADNYSNYGNVAMSHGSTSFSDFFITIDDIEYKLPIRASEFVTYGWQLSLVDEVEINPYNSYHVDGCMGATAYSENGDEIEIGCVYIPDGNKFSYENVYINQIKIESNSRLVSEKRVKVMGTLNLGYFTYKELENAIGNSTYGNSYEEVYYYDESGLKTVDLECSYLSGILDFSFLDAEEDRYKELITDIEYITFDISKYNND